MIFATYIVLAVLATLFSAINCPVAAVVALGVALVLVFAPEFRSLLGMLRAARARRTALLR